MNRAQIQEFRKDFWVSDFLEEGDYGAFVAAILMRPFSVPPPAPAPRKRDEASPNRALARFDEVVPS